MPGDTTPDILLDARAILGECPVWAAEEQSLYWLDCAAPSLHRIDPGTGETRKWALPERTGSFALRSSGGAVLALERGFWTIDLDSGMLDPMADPERNTPGNFFNDGKCDPSGRFWAGTMPRNYEDPSGRLWRLGSDGRCKAMRERIKVPNGLAWSPGGEIFYFSDSARDTTYAFDFDCEAGTLGEPRVFLEPEAAPGYPDGAATDAEGCLWTARWKGGAVARFTPDGKLDRVIEFPVDRVTSVAFGGSDMRTLFVTSARVGLDEQALAAQPHAGAVFALDAGVEGAPVSRFGA